MMHSLASALDFGTPIPRQTRIDAVRAACREVAGHPSSGQAHVNVEVLDTLTRALMHSDEHLGEALIELLEALLDKSSDPSELSRQSGPESGSGSGSGQAEAQAQAQAEAQARARAQDRALILTLTQQVAAAARGARGQALRGKQGQLGHGLASARPTVGRGRPTLGAASGIL